MNHPFKLKNAALLMALAAIYPLVAHSAAGVAQFAIGDVNVRRGAGSTPLAKGQPINSGDSIVTGAAGQTQIRFTDGGLVSLAPNSQFNIDKYADDNNASTDSFAVSFLRGGMRAITGLIGKRNHDNYKVTTNTATIGIRGSAFSANVNPDGTLDVAGEQDGILVCTNAGCVSLIVGEVVRVNSSNSLPKRTSQRSNVPPLVAREDLFVPVNPPDVLRIVDNDVAAKVDLREPAPEIPVIPVIPEVPTTVTLNGVSAMFAFGNGDVDQYPRGGQDPSNGQGTFVVEGQLIQHVGSHGSPASGDLVTVEKTSSGAGSFGTAGLASDPAFIGWGYWDTGRVSGPLVGASDFLGVHYIVGRPTPQNQMPVTGTANYSVVGWTDPTAYDGQTLRVGNLVSAGLTVDFVAARLNAFVNTSFQVDGEALAVQISGLGIISGSTFQSDGSGTGSFSGFFVGDQAARAGLVYGIHDNRIGDVRGSAVFLKDSTFAESVQPYMSALFATSSGEDFDNSPRGGLSQSIGTATFIGKQLSKHDDGVETNYDPYSGISVNTVFASNGPLNSFGSLGTLSSAIDSDFIGWGYWAQGTQSDYNGSSQFAGVHYLVGSPTPQAQMPVTGTAKYNVAGWTNPTAFDGSTLRFGRLDSAGLNVDFSAGRVNAFANTSFDVGAQTVQVLIGGLGYIGNSRFYSTDHGNGSFSGFFVGDQASRAGLIYTAQDGTIGTVTGAVAFEKGGAGDAFVNVPEMHRYSGDSGLAAMFVSGDGGIFDTVPRGARGSYSGTALFIGNQLIDHSENYSGSSGNVTSQVYAQAPVSHSGSLGNVGDADFIGWGYWAKGEKIGSDVGGSGSIEGVHYLVGRPTTQAQMSALTGTANYALAGGTRPTATLNGTTTMGSLIAAGSGLSVNFTGGTVDATIKTQFGATAVTISEQASIYGAKIQGCNVNGFFVGNAAQKAGLIYNKTDGTVGYVTGAAVFQKTP